MSALTPTTLSIRTGSGGTIYVAAVTDGTNTYLLHATADATGAVMTPALDATLQGATTALQQIATTLTGRVKTDPGTF